LRTQLRPTVIAKDDLPMLAAEAAEQWTGTFNPRPFDQQGAMEVYEWAY
jgi:alcohol dehydrogenase class IV